jgi:hypothetical protein
MTLGTSPPPGGALLFEALESGDGGAEVLAESLIFCHAKRHGVRSEIVDDS